MDIRRLLRVLVNAARFAFVRAKVFCINSIAKVFVFYVNYRTLF